MPVATDDSSSIYLADPTIFHHQKNYYLYGTVGGNARNGFLVYVSVENVVEIVKEKDSAVQVR